LIPQRPTVGESVQGFIITDIHALAQRAEAAGGKLAGPVRCIESHKLHCLFAPDPERHVNEAVQLDAQ
jgi:hypothetical protein